MQISTYLLVVCATVACLLPQSVRAADADAQAKAREALRKKTSESQPQPEGGQTNTAAPAAMPASSNEEKMRAAMRQKMNELEAQPAVTAAPPKTKPTAVRATRPAPPKTNEPPAHAQKPAPAPKAASAPASSKPTPARVVVAPPPVDSAATAKEREAMRKKMQELEAQPTLEMAVRPSAGTVPPPKPAATSAPVQAAKPAPPPSTAPVVTAPAPVPAPAPQPAAPAATPSPQPAVAAQPEAAAAATPDALIEAERAAQQQVTNAPKAAKKSKKSALKPTFQFQPLEGPALPISAAKQQRLANLLARYQADEITPAQYHQERAKILAGP